MVGYMQFPIYVDLILYNLTQLRLSITSFSFLPFSYFFDLFKFDCVTFLFPDFHSTLYVGRGCYYSVRVRSRNVTHHEAL